MDSKTFYAALAAQYPRPETDKPVMDASALVKHLRAMQADTVAESSVLESLSKRDTASMPSADHYAVISLLDSYYSRPLQGARLQEDVTGRLMGVVACVNRIALVEGILPLSRNHVALKLLAGLVNLNIGLQDVKGRPRELIEEKFCSALAGLSLLTDKLTSDQPLETARRGLLDLLQSDIASMLDAERVRIEKLEERLIAKEKGQLRKVESKQIAARIINSKMKNQFLPEPIVLFLQGVWFDSLQMILMREGLESAAWLKAVKLTETLIVTLQPDRSRKSKAKKAPAEDSDSSEEDAGSDAVKNEDGKSEDDAPVEDPDEIEDKDLVRIMDHLPKELGGTLIALEHDSTAAREEIEIIQAVHLDLMKGAKFSRYDFEPIPTDEGLLESNTAVSKSLLARVDKLNPGQWFVFAEENKPVRHIKLTLKMSEVKQLLFTNRNGAKVLQVNFDEFAYLLTSETVKVLPRFDNIGLLLRTRLNELIKRKVGSDGKGSDGGSKIKQRAAGQQQQASEHKKEAIVPTSQDGINSEDQPARQNKISELVSQLEFGAIVSLEEPGNEPVTARLMVDDPSGDKFIFADKFGLDLGEYSKAQLGELVAAGQCQILSNGINGTDSFRSAIDRLKSKNVSADPT